MTEHRTPALRPVTVTVPGDVLLDVDGTPLAVGDARHFSGSLYGWDHLINHTTAENKENTEMTIIEQDDYTQVTPEDMEAFRQMLSTTEADTAKWKALSRKNEDRLKATRAELAEARQDAARWERRTNHHLAVVTELRQQNAALLNRLIAEGK